MLLPDAFAYRFFRSEGIRAIDIAGHYYTGIFQALETWTIRIRCYRTAGLRISQDYAVGDSTIILRQCVRDTQASKWYGVVLVWCTWCHQVHQVHQAKPYLGTRTLGPFSSFVFSFFSSSSSS